MLCYLEYSLRSEGVLRVYKNHVTVKTIFGRHVSRHAKSVTNLALAAAKRAAAEQRRPGHTEAIEYETPDGKWHTETVDGSDRPETEVEDAR